MKFVATSEIRSLLRETLGPLGSISPMTQGLLNQNLRIVTRTGAMFLFKAYRPEMPRAKVGDMHRMMAHVVQRGIPVSLPVATYAIGEHAAALYPFVEGTHPERFGKMGRPVRAMGEMLGRVDAALDSFRPAGKKPTSLEVATWNPETMVAEMAEIRASLRGRSKLVRDEVELVLAAYEGVLPQDDWGKRRFAKLPVRVCHNDFHIKNILVRGGAVVAVLDWEKAGWDWRGFEVFRSVMFNCRGPARGLDWKLIAPYLRGYKRFASLSVLERELAFDCGFNKAFFSLWAVKQYVAGNARVRENMLRRSRALPFLFARRGEFRERIAGLLA
ncbi:hypothetical protein EBS80_01210 [bacterium]|nr:hypothetical protein [bacterium]